MVMDNSTLAKMVDDAALNANPIQQLTRFQSFGLEQAYEIQQQSVARRLARGESRCGVKLGFTSREKMAQMGVSTLIVGTLTDAMEIADGAEIDLNNYIHPRVEPEVAFRLSRPICGVISTAEAVHFVDAVAPALEIIDSRFENFLFSLQDVLADNCSSSGFVVGGWQSKHTDVSNLGIILSLDGRPVQSGSTSAILGHPMRALMEASRLVSELELELKAGDIVLAGAATSAIALSRGIAVHAEFQSIGSVAFSVTGQDS